jgi:hypothetical protein
MVHKLQNARQARTGRDMMKSGTPNAPSTWHIFLCPHPHASTQNCLQSAFSFLAIRFSCRDVAVFVFRKPLVINLTLAYLCLLHEYHVMYSVRYYLPVSRNRGRSWNILPAIRGHTSIHILYIHFKNLRDWCENGSIVLQ